MSLFEGSSRVPLMSCAPGLPAGRVDAPASTIDVCPTLAIEYAAEASYAPVVALRDGQFKYVRCTWTRNCCSIW